MPRISTLASKGFAATGLPRPVNTVAPVVSGTAQARQTLSTTTGTWTGIGLTYSYQWQSGTTNISGATSSTYVVESIYVGSTIRCVVTALNFGNAVASNSNSTSTVAAAVPAAPIIGVAASTGSTTATVSFTAPDNGGSTITSYTATSSPGNITGTLNQAGSGTITVSGLTGGTNYTFTVRATNSIGTSANSSASNQITTGAAAPVNTVAPVVSGTAQARQTLSSTTGTWTGTGITYTYQWQYGTTNISGATSSTYVIDPAYVGFTIRCVVTATNGGGSVSANSNNTSAVIANVPLAPTIGTATATGPNSANVQFTAPSSNGGATITTYTATSSPGGITGTLSQAGSGTISVTGLSASTNYTFTVTATNSAGTSAASGASNQITTFVAWDMLLMGGGGGTIDLAQNIYIGPGSGDDDIIEPPNSTYWIGGGGGGAGGLLTTTSSSQSGNSLYITVGAGGSGATNGGSSYYALTSGGSAVITALGGGQGGLTTNGYNGFAGGSGGGGSFQYISGNTSGGTGTSGQGNNGGAGGASLSAGGGGGKVGAGQNGSTTAYVGGNGGTGYDLALFKGGSANIVAYGGGGGYNSYYAATNGTNGSSTYSTNSNGPNNTGGGARGEGSGYSAGINQPSRTKTGGSGIVIIRYPGSVAKATGGTTYTATVGGTAYYFHEFTASGTLTFT